MGQSKRTTRKTLEARLAAVQPPQEHLLAFWDELDESQRQVLAQQIESLDLERVSTLIANHVFDRGDDDENPWAKLAQQASPPPALRLDDGDSRFTAEQARQRGKDELRAGRCGMILVAGGQGTRLGFNHSKGMYPLGPISNRSLYQIIIEHLLAVARRYSTRIPLYLMTSPATHDETIEFLDQHQRFGLASDDLFIFCQGMLPAIDGAGKILLASKNSIALSPDGHGGLLAALANSGCLDDAKRRGVEHLFYAQIDNPLVQICDPTLIGFHALNESELSTQAVAKTSPMERVGNVVSLDGRLRIIEYIDLPEDIAHQQNADGSLRLWSGNIAVHVFDRRFLRRMHDQSGALPFHCAKKKTPHIDGSGRPIKPDSPNATKFEQFIFDLLPHARNALVVEVDRAKGFAPVKNSNDEEFDTPATAQAAMVAEHRNWLHEIGVDVAPRIKIEINPLFALDADELAAKIENVSSVREDTYFC